MTQCSNWSPDSAAAAGSGLARRASSPPGRRSWTHRASCIFPDPCFRQLSERARRLAQCCRSGRAAVVSSSSRQAAACPSKAGVVPPSCTGYSCSSQAQATPRGGQAIASPRKAGVSLRAANGAPTGSALGRQCARDLHLASGPSAELAPDHHRARCRARPLAGDRRLGCDSVPSIRSAAAAETQTHPQRFA